MASDGGRVPCPRCGTPMEFWVEIELGNGVKKIKYYYRCPRCGYKIQDAVLVVSRSDGKIVIEREEYLRPVRSRVGQRAR